MNDIAAAEALVYARRPEAGPRLVELLYRLVTGKLQLGGNAPDADPGPEATRFAAAFGAWLLDPAVRLAERDLGQLSLLGRTIDAVFAASGFGSTDHLLTALGAGDTASFAALWGKDRQRYAKALAAYSLDSALPIDPEAIFAGPAPFALLAFLNLSSSKRITGAAGQARRERLIDLAPRVAGADLPRTLDHLVMLSSAWMLCSYAARRDKHQVKASLNPVLRRWMLAGGMTDAELPPTRTLQERPMLLVAAEIMHSNHVQYRYFGQYLRQLRQRFRMVLLTEENQVDDAVRALYDEVHVYRRNPDGSTLAEAVALVKRLRPDLIFWLSVGMRHWGPAMASLRLAPIQFTALGHSASTFCEAIDYYLTEEGYAGDPALFSEQLVLLPDASLVFERSPHYQPVAPRPRERASPLRVALPSNLLKLNPSFIAVLKRIQDAAGRPMEFHVFPNVSGLELSDTRRVLSRTLKNCRVYRTMAYNQYLERLTACDLNLSPFPFGGLHSVVDSLRQGLPVVAMEGMEPHARTDAMLLRRLGMPEWLICHQVDGAEGYVAAALRIINDDAQRLALARQALALDVDRVLFGDATTPLRSEVADAVWWLYRNHEAIKASGRKSFGAADRAAFPAR